jgi:hypothetical protein
VTKEQFNLWKHDPVSKWFFNYLVNKRAFLKSAAIDIWMADPKNLSETVRGQVIELEEICDLSHEMIEAFYQERQEIHGTDPESSERQQSGISAGDLLRHQ